LAALAARTARPDAAEKHHAGAEALFRALGMTAEVGRAE
jgi:hypothetical protein